MGPSAHCGWAKASAYAGSLLITHFLARFEAIHDVHACLCESMLQQQHHIDLWLLDKASMTEQQQRPRHLALEIFQGVLQAA